MMPQAFDPQSLQHDISRLKSKLQESEGRFEKLRLQGAPEIQLEDPCRTCTNLAEIEHFSARVFLEVKPLIDAAIVPLLSDSRAIDEEVRGQMIADFKELVRPTIWCKRALAKPLGYAGDYALMHFIYCYKAHCDVGQYASLQGWLIDRWTMHYALDIKDRTCMLARIISAHLDGRGTGDRFGVPEVSICSIACGPFGELADFIQLKKDLTIPICFTGLDNDSNALAFVAERYRNLCSQEIHGEASSSKIRVALEKVNVVSRKGTSSLASRLKEQDLIYSIGLMDYLEDKHVRQIADWAFGMLRPGGMLVLGNFVEDPTSWVFRVTKTFMSDVLEWPLRYRTTEEFCALIETSRFGSAGGKVHIHQGPHGLQMYASIVKLGHGHERLAHSKL